MTKKLQILLVFLALTCTGISQSEFTLPADINPKFNFIKAYDSLLKIAPKFVTAAEWKAFCIDVTYNIQINYDKNHFYTNWNDATSYLEKVMKQVCKTDISDKKNDLVIYILKDEDINASALPTGKIFINVGLLANTANEASLSEILGHEYAHYRFGHGMDDLSDYYKTHKKYKSDKKLTHYAKFFARKRMGETQADSLGFILSGRAGYDIRNGITNIQAFDTEEKLYKSTYSYRSLKHEIYIDPQKDWTLNPDSADYYFSTHPANPQRKKELSKLVSLFRSNNKNYIVDSVAFCKIQEKARQEVLQITFNRGNYEDCLKNAFRFHLLDTTNNTYLYYLTESIRRFMYINPSLKDKGFLTYDSKDPAFKEGRYGILRKINAFIIDTLQYQKIKEHPLIKNLYRPFDTNIQAYRYFVKKCKQRNINEIYLSEGLYYYWLNNKKASDSLLNMYLAKGDGTNREFTRKLIDGDLFKDQPGPHLVIIDNSDYYNTVEGLDEYNYMLAWQDFKHNNEIKKDVTSLLDNSKPVILTDYVKESNKESYGKYIHIVNLFKRFKTDAEHEEMVRPGQTENYWKSLMQSEPENPELLVRQKKLFIMCPELFLILRKEQVNDICFIDFLNYKGTLSVNIYNARFINPYLNEMKAVEKEPELFKLKESYPKMLEKIIKKFYK